MKDRATQLLVKYKSGALVTQLHHYMITNMTKMITVMMIQNNDNYDNIDMHGDHNNDDDY